MDVEFGKQEAKKKERTCTRALFGAVSMDRIRTHPITLLTHHDPHSQHLQYKHIEFSQITHSLAFPACVLKNNTQAATIALATTVKTTCVPHPLCTNASRRLYRLTVLI